MKTYLHRASNLKSTITFLIFVLLSLALAVMCGLNEVLAGSLADCVLADTILIPTIPPTNLKKVRGPRKSTETINRKNIY